MCETTGGEISGQRTDGRTSGIMEVMAAEMKGEDDVEEGRKPVVIGKRSLAYYYGAFDRK